MHLVSAVARTIVRNLPDFTRAATSAREASRSEIAGHFSALLTTTRRLTAVRTILFATIQTACMRLELSLSFSFRRDGTGPHLLLQTLTQPEPLDLVKSHDCISSAVPSFTMFHSGRSV